MSSSRAAGAEASETRKPVLIWDVGGVIVNWNAKTFAASYEDGRFEREFGIILGAEDWFNFDKGILSFKELVIKKASEIGQDEAKTEEMIRSVFRSLAPKMDVIELIRDLDKKGYRQYCLSNGSTEYVKEVNSEQYKARYDGFTLHSLFPPEKFLVSAPHKMAKPEAEFYQLAQETFDCDPSRDQIIFVDDSQKNIDGAKAVGWDGIVFDGDLEKLKVALSERGVKFDDSLKFGI